MTLIRLGDSVAAVTVRGRSASVYRITPDEVWI